MARESQIGKQDKAISALLVEPTVAKAAKRAKVGFRTLQRWLHEDPYFQQRYREARGQLVGQAVSAMAHAAEEAVATLAAVMEDAQAPASARVSAARTLLEMAIKSTGVAPAQKHQVTGKMETSIEDLVIALIHGNGAQPGGDDEG